MPGFLTRHAYAPSKGPERCLARESRRFLCFTREVVSRYVPDFDQHRIRTLAGDGKKTTKRLHDYQMARNANTRATLACKRH